MIWASDISQSAHRKGPPNRNSYRAAARACKCKNIGKYGGIFRGVVFLKIEETERIPEIRIVKLDDFASLITNVCSG